MTFLPLLAADIIMNIVSVLFVLCSVALILIVLLQKGRGGGLSGAFGGAMASGVLGSKTGDFLTWVTIVLAGVFFCLAILLARFYKPTVGSYGEETPVQAQTTTALPQSGSDLAGIETDDAERAVPPITSAEPEPALEENEIDLESIPVDDNNTVASPGD